MGLYLCIFDGGEDVAGLDAAAYGDWALFINAVIAHVEGGQRGSRVPVLTLHSDCDGEWSPAECVELVRALDEIERIFRKLPPEPPRDGWRAEVAKEEGLRFETLYDCFFDVDGENLIERLRGLAKLAQSLDRPIAFQ
jgi:hypothetical protein